MNLNTEFMNHLSDALLDTSMSGNELLGSLESMLDASNVSVSDHASMMKARKAIQVSLCSSCVDAPEQRKTPDYVVETSSKEFSVMIDRNLIFAFMMAPYQHEVIAKFIGDLVNIPEDGVLYVYSSLPFEELGYIMLFDGVALINMLTMARCKKIFKFGSSTTPADLLVASRCDAIEVGDYANVCIVSADRSNIMSGYVQEAYRDLVKFSYRYWVEKGLFTPDEVAGLFSNEAEHGIILFSDEIKRRLKQ